MAIKTLQEKSLNAKAHSFWDTVPTPIKIVVYHAITNLMISLGSILVTGKIDKDQLIMALLIWIGNEMLWAAQSFSKPE